MEYTSYERVKTALEHKEPDRVPFDLGGTCVTGINTIALKNLQKYLGLSEEQVLWDPITQLAKTPDDLFERFQVDVKNVGPESPMGNFQDLGLQGDHYRLIDEFGIGWQMPLDGGHYYDLYLHPLKDAETVQDVENFPWPDPLDPARYVNLKGRVDHVVYDEKKAYVAGRMSAGMWENAIWMCGYEKFLTDMLVNKKLIHAIMSKFVEIKMKYWEKYLEEVGDNVLVISEADDLGTQNGLLVSLDLYRELIWPYHKQLFEFIKRKAQSKVYIFQHCDGGVYDAIPSIIEAGVDILNPVQIGCKGMDTKKIKQEFGSELSFWGASCDNNILNFGTPEQVREETKRRIDDLAPGGGFIFGSIHVIQSPVPPENIMAWWETWQEYGKY